MSGLLGVLVSVEFNGTLNRNILDTWFANVQNIANIDLSDRNIIEIEANAFSGLKNADYLSLKANKLKRLDPFVFNGLNSRLDSLLLADNQLIKIEASTFSPLTGI